MLRKALSRWLGVPHDFSPGYFQREIVDISREIGVLKTLLLRHTPSTWDELQDELKKVRDSFQ